MGDILDSIREIHHIGHDTPEQLVPVNVFPKLKARGLWAVGLSDAGVEYEMSRPQPEAGHVVVCFGGEGQVLVDGQWITCGPGMAYLSPPHKPMAFRTVGKKRWQFAWVYLTATPGEPSPVPGEKSVLVDADPRQLVAAIEGLYRESTGDADAVVTDTWISLVRHYVHALAHTRDATDPLWRLWAEVDASVAEPWTLDLLAERAGMGPEALRRACLKHLKLSPMKQVTNLRMRRAEAMLRSSPSKLYAIARAVGYKNVFAFSAAFTRWHGLPPNQCRGS